MLMNIGNIKYHGRCTPHLRRTQGTCKIILLVIITYDRVRVISPVSNRVPNLKSSAVTLRRLHFKRV